MAVRPHTGGVVVGLIDWAGAGERKSANLPSPDEPVDTAAEEAVVDNRGEGMRESIRRINWTLR